jgi:hypothetical protein
MRAIMDCTKTGWLVAVLVCASCTAEDGDDTGAGTTDGSATTPDDSSSTTASSTMSDDDPSADDDVGTTGAASSEGTSGDAETHATHDEGTTHAHDTSSGSTDTGSETSPPSVCDVIGEGCHDNKTPEGIDCHLVGHDGDEAACMEIFDMCAEICGL